jgi:hypothetical protein
MTAPGRPNGNGGSGSYHNDVIFISEQPDANILDKDFLRTVVVIGACRAADGWRIA